MSFEEPRRFVVRATGNIPGSESLATFRQILDDPRFGPGATVLAVVTGAKSAPATDELTSIAIALKDLFRKGLGGFVIVTEPGFIFGVARMFTVAAEMMGVRTQVTQDELEGRRLLDIIEREIAEKQ